MRKIVCLLALLVFGSAIAFAQPRVVTGRVVDEKGDPVSGASILIKGTTTGASANADGDFRITAKTGDVLEISATNFARQEVKLTNQTSVSVRLSRTGAVIDEVIVTALGVQRQSKELGYSTAKVRAAELTQGKVVNLQNGLTGKVSGLNIQTVNNGVFADTRITLRGIRSLTGNNQPMLIVDGVPIALTYINSINPNDITDVTLLKSSSATAVYGPEGVNGAIIVTTRKGSRGGKPSVTLSHTVQLETVSFMPKFQTGFGSGSSVDAYGFGVYDPIENQGYGDAFDGSMRQIGRDAPDGSKYMVSYVSRINEKKKFWNTGVTNQTDVSFSAGDFYMSAQNVSINGVLPKDENHRTTLHMSSAKEYNKFKASFNLTYAQSNYNINAGANFGNGRDYTPYWNLINAPAQIPITNFKNWDAPFTDYSQNSSYWSHPNGYFSDYYYNPYFMVDNFRQTGRSDDIIGNIELNYKLTSWINVIYRLGTTVTNSNAKSIQKPFTYSPFAKASGKSTAATGDLVGAVADGTSFSSRINSELFANFSKSFSQFKIDGLVGTSFREIKAKNINVSSTNLGIPGVYNIAVRKGEPGASEGDSKTRLVRFFGKASIGYDNWAFLEGTASYDQDTRLGYYYDFKVPNISFFYPGASLSAVLSEAIPAIKNSKAVSFAKIRGSISKTGNVNLGAYSLENTYSAAAGFPYGTLLGFTSDNTLRRDKYEPEFVLNKEVGLELGFMKNRINFEATAYHQDNTNQLITVAYSATTGFSSALLNAASFTNKGIELDLKLTPLIRFNKGNIDFKVNYTYQTNKVTKLIEGVDELGIGNGNYIIKGMPAYTFKLTDYVKDSLGRVIVDKTTGYPSVDPVIKTFGQTLPKHIVGMSLNVNWKAFSLNAVADYRGGNQIYSGIGPDMDFSGISYRSGQNGRQPFIFPNSVYNDGTKLVPNTSVYTQSGGYNFWSQSINTTVNSNYLSDGSFWKLREVAITYNLPSRLFSFTNNAIKSASFSLTGRNLITWIPSTNEWTDPEFSNTTGNAQGVNDRNNTPPTRIFGANLTVNF